MHSVVVSLPDSRMTPLWCSPQISPNTTDPSFHQREPEQGPLNRQGGWVATPEIPSVEPSRTSIAGQLAWSRSRTNGPQLRPFGERLRFLGPWIREANEF